MDKIFNYTPDQKREAMGDGEWCYEPDEAYFEHAGLKCRINRAVRLDPPYGCFGGHLCGYVQVSSDHLYYNKDIMDLDFDHDLDVHGGVTWSKMDDLDNTYWIGFDCAHCYDLVPTMNKMSQENDALRKLKELFQDMTCDYYRNFDFVVEECKKLAEQLVAVKT